MFATNLTREGHQVCGYEFTTTGVEDKSSTQNVSEELTILYNSRFNISIFDDKLMQRYREPESCG